MNLILSLLLFILLGSFIFSFSFAGTWPGEFGLVCLVCAFCAYKLIKNNLTLTRTYSRPMEIYSYLLCFKSRVGLQMWHYWERTFSILHWWPVCYLWFDCSLDFCSNRCKYCHPAKISINSGPRVIGFASRCFLFMSIVAPIDRAGLEPLKTTFRGGFSWRKGST